MSRFVFPLERNIITLEKILWFLLNCYHIQKVKHIFILSKILKSKQDLARSLGWEILNKFTATPSGPTVLSNHEIEQVQEVDHLLTNQNLGHCSQARHKFWLQSPTAHTGGRAVFMNSLVWSCYMVTHMLVIDCCGDCWEHLTLTKSSEFSKMVASWRILYIVHMRKGFNEDTALKLGGSLWPPRGRLYRFQILVLDRRPYFINV